MPLKFCPKCGTLMIPQSKGGSLVFVCRKCGYEEHISKKESYLTTIAHPKRSRKKEIIVIEKETSLKVLPKTNITCPKCGHNEAYFWTIQTRAADEPATRFFKCVKCGYTWREYD